MTTSQSTPPRPLAIECPSDAHSDSTDGALRSRARIPEHLEFIARLLESYPTTEQRHADLSAEIARLSTRYDDPRFYLGVIGEFSAGKSTLINALIGDDLLRTDVLQGTTATATTLEYAARRDATVAWSDGRTARFSDAGVDQDILSWVHRYTAEESEASRVSSVVIEHPSTVLRHGLVIVDTPGLNVDNERHVGVTVRAVRERCDAFLVVMPATSAASDLLCTFLRTHLPGILHRCVFVLTKGDLLRSTDEQTRVVANAQARLTKELGLAREARVVLCAPEVSLAVVTGNDPNSGRSRPLDQSTIGVWCETFGRARRGIVETVHRERMVTIVEGMTSGLGELLQRLDEGVSTAQADYQRRHAALARHRVSDLSAFIERKSEKCAELFGKRMESVFTAKAAWFDRRIDEISEALLSSLRNADSPEELARVVKSVPRKLLEDAQSELGRKTRRWRKDLATFAQEQHSEFEQEFRQLYESLATLGGELPGRGSRPVELAGIDKAVASMDAIGLTLTQSAESETQATRGGSALGGATAGFLVAGPVGALVGGLLGLGASFFFGPDMDKLRQEALDRLAPLMDKAINDLNEACTDEVRGVTGPAAEALDGMFQAYAEKYAELVDQMIQRDDTARHELSRLEKQAAEDREALKQRTQMLAQTRAECVAL